MHPNPLAPSPSDLDLLDRVARCLARSRGLSPADVDDFTQTVHLRMAERNYDVFERYEARASFRTYLTVVVARLLKDWQNRHLGKWRPSAAAVRLGPEAVRLDREVNRDGAPPEEAARTVASLCGRSEREVSTLLEQLPRRAKRRLVTLDLANQRPVPFADPLDRALETSNMAVARRAVAKALAAIAPADARLFVARYVQHRSVARIAKAEFADAKALYRRFDRIRKTLRDRVVEQGVHGSACLD